MSWTQTNFSGGLGRQWTQCSLIPHTHTSRLLGGLTLSLTCSCLMPTPMTVTSLRRKATAASGTLASPLQARRHEASRARGVKLNAQTCGISWLRRSRTTGFVKHDAHRITHLHARTRTHTHTHTHTQTHRHIPNTHTGDASLRRAICLGAGASSADFLPGAFQMDTNRSRSPSYSHTHTHMLSLRNKQT